MSTARLCDLALVNPASPEFEKLSSDDSVAFLPMENVWPDGLSFEERVKSQVEVGYTRFQPGDVLVPKIAPTFGHGRSAVADGLPTGAGAGTTELHVLRPKPGVDPRWLFYVTKAAPFLQEGIATQYGVAGQKRISFDWFRTFRIPDLPLEEQRRIVDHLDTETARIDDLITEQETLISLLSERLYAHASESLGARLGGEPGPLGSVLRKTNAHWQLVPLRHLASIQSGITLGKTYDSGAEPYPYLRVANVRDGEINTDDVTAVEVPPSVAARHLLRTGDVLMTEGGDNDKLGRGAIWDGSIDPCLHQNHIFAVRTGPELHPEFLSALLASSWGRAYFTATAHQTTNLASTNRAKVGRLPVPLPHRAAQVVIVNELEAASSRTAAIAEETRRQVRLLQEHRQALITAAVTGGLEAVGRVA